MSRKALQILVFIVGVLLSALLGWLLGYLFLGRSWALPAAILAVILFCLQLRNLYKRFPPRR